MHSLPAPPPVSRPHQPPDRLELAGGICQFCRRGDVTDAARRRVLQQVGHQRYLRLLGLGHALCELLLRCHLCKGCSIVCLNDEGAVDDARLIAAVERAGYQAVVAD